MSGHAVYNLKVGIDACKVVEPNGEKLKTLEQWICYKHWHWSILSENVIFLKLYS